jgi:MoaA/NifB/PqqE/SkfB family radical SAM enzyme
MNRHPDNLDDILASPALGEDFFRAEETFRNLPLEEKVRRVMSYQPRTFQVETTTRCNLNCPLCSTHHLQRGRRETRLETIKGIVEANPLMRFMCLHLMGDPLLSKSIFSIIEYLKSKGVYTYFSTNGMLLKEKVTEILSSGLDKISISLDGINQEDLALYRVGADLGRIVSGIRMLREERNSRALKAPLIQIQTLMFSYNEIKEPEVVSFLKSLGVDRIKLKKPSFDTFGGENEGSGSFERAHRDAVGKYSRKQKDYVKYRDRAVCRLLFQGFALSDGSVAPCCIDYEGRHAFGDLNDRTWAEIWSSDKRREVLARHFSGELEVCKQCSLGYEYSTTVFDQD